MTIDKIIKTLLWFENYNEDKYCGGDRIQDEHGDWFYKVTEEDFEVFRQAVDTMRKYLNIKGIINIYDSTDISYKDTLQDIRKVLEDGNNRA